MGTALMARRNKQNTRGAAIAQAIMEEYQPQTREEMQDAIKDIFGPMFESMLQGEMDSHLGYGSNERGEKNTTNRRNGYSHKSVNTAYGKMDVSVPRDREGSFKPKAIPKRTKDVSGIEDKVLSMYARGMSQRDIADTVEDIYGFDISHETISTITDRVIATAEEWQNRPLSGVYPIVFIDAIHFSVRDNGIIRKLAAYVVLGINEDGYKRGHDH